MDFVCKKTPCRWDCKQCGVSVIGHFHSCPSTGEIYLCDGSMVEFGKYTRERPRTHKESRARTRKGEP